MPWGQVSPERWKYIQWSKLNGVSSARNYLAYHRSVFLNCLYRSNLIDWIQVGPLEPFSNGQTKLEIQAIHSRPCYRTMKKALVWRLPTMTSAKQVVKSSMTQKLSVQPGDRFRSHTLAFGNQSQPILGTPLPALVWRLSPASTAAASLDIPSLQWQLTQKLKPAAPLKPRFCNRPYRIHRCSRFTSGH